MAGTVGLIKVAAILAVILGVMAEPCLAKASLKSGESLKAGQSLNYAQYKFIMQTDCNLVLYANNVKVLWASGTNGKGGAATCRLSMQSDGNLVIYAGNTPVWASKTSRALKSYTLQVQGDGNVVIYGPSGAIWATNTKQKKAKKLL